MKCASCGYSDDVQREPADRRSWDPSGSGLCSGCCLTVPDVEPEAPSATGVADHESEPAGDETTGAAR